MINQLVFLEQVAEDAALAYAYYESRLEGLGDEFLALFYASARDLIRNSLLYRVVHRDFRRRLLRRFPYAIYYRVLDSQIVVCGLFHCARDPGSVTDDLESR
jgi:plasmid stabilization system protein ParE